MPSRRELLELAAVAAPVALLTACKPATAPAADASTTSTPAAAQAAPGPWPSFEKLAKNNAEARELIAKVKLRNGDPPDALPRPCPKPLHGGAR